MNAEPIIGRRQFTDGKTRDVYEVATGQYVLGDDGRMVRGEAWGRLQSRARVHGGGEGRREQDVPTAKPRPARAPAHGEGEGEAK